MSDNALLASAAQVGHTSFSDALAMDKIPLVGRGVLFPVLLMQHD